MMKLMTVDCQSDKSSPRNAALPHPKALKQRRIPEENTGQQNQPRPDVQTLADIAPVTESATAHASSRRSRHCDLREQMLTSPHLNKTPAISSASIADRNADKRPAHEGSR